MRSKFNVDKNKAKRTLDGIVFDSQLEMRFYRDEIIPKSKSGEIVFWERQKPYILQDGFKYCGKRVLPIKYIADFFVRFSDGREIVIDVKGFPDSAALLKRKMFWYRYPDIDYRWICYSAIDGGWVDYDYVMSQKRKRKKEKK